MTEFLAQIEESEWISLHDWASQRGSSGFAQEAIEFLRLLRSLGVTDLSKEQATLGLAILSWAVGSGFKMSKSNADEARRRNEKLESAVSDLSSISNPREPDDELVNALTQLLISGQLSDMIAFLTLMGGNEWISLFVWASKNGSSEIVKEAMICRHLLWTLGVANFREERARNGLTILLQATELGFNMRRELADDARRRGKLLRPHSSA